MIKVQSFSDVLERYFVLSGKVLIDVGCGTGDLVRWATRQGARAIGIDTAAMITGAERKPRAGDERYRIGTAETMSFENGSCDILTYFASFHHVPRFHMINALKRGWNVLKPGGAAVFLEPIPQDGSYYDIVRLIEDEMEVRALAIRVIDSALYLGFKPAAQKLFYVDRSFADFLELLEASVDDAGRRAEITAAARKATERLAWERGERFDEVRYRSICRTYILEKTSLRGEAVRGLFPEGVWDT